MPNVFSTKYTDLMVRVLTIELQMYVQRKATWQSGALTPWSHMSEECSARRNQDVGIELVEALARAQEVPEVRPVSTFYTPAGQGWREEPPHMRNKDLRTDTSGPDGHDSTMLKMESEASGMLRVPMAETLSDRVAYQCMRNGDLRTKGQSLIDDQGIVFEGTKPIDKMHRQFITQGQENQASPGPGQRNDHDRGDSLD